MLCWALLLPLPRQLRCGRHTRHADVHFQRDRNLGTRASYRQSVADTSSASSIFNDLGMEDAFSVRWL